jgi:hypothetical protein
MLACGISEAATDGARVTQVEVVAEHGSQCLSATQLPRWARVVPASWLRVRAALRLQATCELVSVKWLQSYLL